MILTHDNRASQGPAFKWDLILSGLPGTWVAAIPAAIDGTAYAYPQASKAAASKRAYASDFRDFQTECEEQDETALPAFVLATGQYLSAGVAGDLKASTIRRRSAAITYFHRVPALSPHPGRRTGRSSSP